MSVSPSPGVRAGELLGDGVSMLLLYPGVKPGISELTFLLWFGVGFRMMLDLDVIVGAVESCEGRDFATSRGVSSAIEGTTASLSCCLCCAVATEGTRDMIGLIERVELVSLLETPEFVLSRDTGEAGTELSP